MSDCGPDYKTESIVSVDLKGQIVLPKNLRERAGFKHQRRNTPKTFPQPSEKAYFFLWDLIVPIGGYSFLNLLAF
jgi:hypothetical protein